MVDDADMKQLAEDKKLVERIDKFGKGLRPKEVEIVESFMRWLERGRPLTTRQRELALRIDEERV